MKAYRLETISRINAVSSSLGAARIFGISRRARVAETAIAIPRSSKSPRIWLISASMIDQPLPRTVERLDVLLLERLFWHEPHVRLLDRRADCLGVVGIVLLPAYEWFHVLRRHDLHGVTELLELPLPIECARGGFDADEARFQFANDLQQLIAATPDVPVPNVPFGQRRGVGKHSLPGRYRVCELSLLTSLTIALFVIFAIGERKPSIPLSGKRRRSRILSAAGKASWATSHQKSVALR